MKMLHQETFHNLLHNSFNVMRTDKSYSFSTITSTHAMDIIFFQQFQILFLLGIHKFVVAA